MMKNLLFLLFTALTLGSCSSTEQQTEIRWATFNIRYDNPSDAPNDWQGRKDRVAQYILDEQIDIVGMQEVLHNQFLDLKTALPQHEGIGVGRDDGKTQGEYAPIFYRKDKYEVLDSNTFWLSENPDSVGKMGWDAVCTRIATWAKLKDKASGKVFMAVNTHFDHVGEVARRESALLIIRKIKEIVGDRPAVLTGDFNVTEESDAYRTLTTNEFVLLDAQKAAEVVEGIGYTFHHFNRYPMEERTKIDFVFVTPGIEVKRSAIPDVVPDALLSDHNPQMVELEF